MLGLQVQMHSNMPVCPLCRTPFDGDINLAPNLDLRAALECAEQAAAAARAAEDRRMVAVYNSKQIVKPSRDKTTRSHQQRFIYDLPYPEETGPWIPVSIPPKGSKDFDGPDMGSIYGDVFPEPLMTVGVRQGAPDINLWNVLSGFLAIISGRGGTQSQNFHSQSGYSDSRTSTYYRESSGHGRSNSNSWSGNLHRPSAPPLLLGTNDSDVSLIRAILEAEPPDWMPDSSALSCMLCGAAFRAITCGRHHCRFCGGIFCRRCSSGRCLLPVKFRDRDPKRVCDTCWERLEPVQKNLADRVSNAAQIALHDVTDFSCMTAWINSPLGLSMEQEIFKATNALRSYLEVGHWLSYFLRQYPWLLLSVVYRVAGGVVQLSIRLTRSVSFADWSTQTRKIHPRRCSERSLWLGNHHSVQGRVYDDLQIWYGIGCFTEERWVLVCTISYRIVWSGMGSSGSHYPTISRLFYLFCFVFSLSLWITFRCMSEIYIGW